MLYLCVMFVTVNKVTGANIKLLTAEDAKELIPPIGDRRAFLTYLQAPQSVVESSQGGFISSKFLPRFVGFLTRL